MKSKLLNSVLLVCFIWALCGPAEVFARWEDHSDELPGMDNGGSNTILLVSGVVLVGLIVYQLVKKPGDSDQVSLGGNDGDGIPLVSDDTSQNEQEQKMNPQDSQFGIDPLLILDKNGIGAGVVFIF